MRTTNGYGMNGFFLHIHAPLANYPQTKSFGERAAHPEQRLQDGTALLGVHVHPTPCFIWHYPKHRAWFHTGTGSLPAGTHKERLAQAMHSRNKNALDYLPNRQKCSHLTSKGQSHFCPSLPTQGVEDLIS